MARILFLGLDDENPVSLHSRLRLVLQDLGHVIISRESAVLTTVDAVFCDSDSPEFPPMLVAIRSLHPTIPVVAVTSHGGHRKWPESSETGIYNYRCAPPFEASQLARIVAMINERAGNREISSHCCHAA